MSKIDGLIKQLQIKKNKIDYIAYVTDLLKNDKHCIDFKDVQKDVLAELEPLLAKLSENIENDLPTELIEQRKADFESDEIRILKLLAQKAKSIPTQSQTETPKVEQPQQAPAAPAKPARSPAAMQDKMSFAMDNRHLANKRVQVINDQNVQINGNVVGLDAPYVIVKTDTGPTIEVPLDKVVLQ